MNVDADLDERDDRELRLVRPYALTGGRTRARTGHMPIEAMVVATPAGLGAGELRHEARQIVDMCRAPMSVAEVSARVGITLGVARVLVGDLVGDGYVDVKGGSGDGRPDVGLLTRVLEGLQAL